jgi:hypothetical protein
VRLERKEEELMKKGAGNAEEVMARGLEHVTGMTSPPAVPAVDEEVKGVGAWILENEGDEIFQAATTVKREQLFTLAQKALPGMAHRLRKNKSIAGAGSLLALITAHGPGCSNLGQI